IIGTAVVAGRADRHVVAAQRNGFAEMIVFFAFQARFDLGQPAVRRQARDARPGDSAAVEDKRAPLAAAGVVDAVPERRADYDAVGIHGERAAEPLAGIRL